MSRVREGRELILGWMPIHRLVAKERLANLEFSKQDISRTMVAGGRHGKDRPAIWVDADGGMIVDLMTAGVAATSPAASAGSAMGPTDFPPNGATSRSSGGDAPVTVTEPVSAPSTDVHHLAEIIRVCGATEQHADSAARYMGLAGNVLDETDFKRTLARTDLPSAQRDRVFDIWAGERGWSTAGIGLQNSGVSEAPREQPLFVAINGEIQPVDLRDPAGLPYGVALHNADAQIARMAVVAPVPGPDLSELLGIPAIDLVRGAALLGSEPNVVATDADSAIRLEDSRRRWALLEGALGKLPGILEDGIKAWREGGKGEIRRRVLRQGGAEPGPKEATNTVACSGCAELIDCPIGWTEFLCPACGAETILPGNNGEDVFADKNGFDEVGYVEKQAGAAPEGTGQDSDEPGQGEIARSRSGVSTGARAGVADS